MSDNTQKATVIFIGVIVSGSIALSVVLACILLPIFDLTVPTFLEQWGGVIVGFYFGAFSNLVKDWMGIRSSIDNAEGAKNSVSNELGV